MELGGAELLYRRFALALAVLLHIRAAVAVHLDARVG